MSWDIILFDMDGTLSDSGLGISRCAHYALTEMGFPVGEPETLRHFVGPPLEESFRLRHGLNEEETVQAVGLFRARYKEKGIQEHAPYPGVQTMIRALHAAGKRLALASSKPRIYAEKILKDYGIRDCFEHVMGSEFDGRFGSKTLVMEELMRRFQADEALKQTMVMVGDRIYDVEGAENLGMPCVAVGYGYAEPGELDRATYFVESVEQLQQLLLKGGK